MLGIVAALCGVAASAWFKARPLRGRALEAGLAGAFAAGAFALAAARFLPVHVADAGARMAVRAEARCCCWRAGGRSGTCGGAEGMAA